ncbi:hypothetical protein AB2M62_17930 [Sphingomonas sp. MMS12-HWE2-04]|uniref:hypothetical protein n=1 Tax=Sphingomonas sp. MMS12-HWE2-04 TaxID=3234199 RepID=UPI00384C7990
MSFLRSLSPLRALRDLRFFLAQRKQHELWFMILAMLITFGVLFVFIKDSRVAVPYKRNIIYFESWPLTRTDEQIRAQQKIDQAKKAIEQAEYEKRLKKRQEQFQRLDKNVSKWL